MDATFQIGNFGLIDQFILKSITTRICSLVYNFALTILNCKFWYSATSNFGVMTLILNVGDIFWGKSIKFQVMF